MISHQQILRMLDAGQSSRLVQRILLNGRCSNQCVVGLLCQPGIAAPAAIGLALQRAGELSYRATSLMDQLAARLVMFQNCDGTFGNLRCATDALRLAVTAVAVRGWLSWLDANAREVHTAIGQGILEGARRGLEAIGEAFNGAESIGDNTAVWAIVLWQLGGRAELRQLVDVDGALHRLETSAHNAVLEDLFAYARAMAA